MCTRCNWSFLFLPLPSERWLYQRRAVPAVGFILRLPRSHVSWVSVKSTPSWTRAYDTENCKQLASNRLFGHTVSVLLSPSGIVCVLSAALRSWGVYISKWQEEKRICWLMTVEARSPALHRYGCLPQEMWSHPLPLQSWGRTTWWDTWGKTEKQSAHLVKQHFF